jgi:hypothetical protein
LGGCAATSPAPRYRRSPGKIRRVLQRTLTPQLPGAGPDTAPTKWHDRIILIYVNLLQPHNILKIPGAGS